MVKGNRKKLEAPLLADAHNFPNFSGAAKAVQIENFYSFTEKTLR